MNGRYTFTRAQALQSLGCSKAALKESLKRLVVKKQVAKIRRDFFVVVPAEYRKMGVPPPSWFIDDLMHFHDQPYYVGILSAAAIHGAAHQQPNEFQVVTTKPLRTIQVGSVKLQFFVNNNLEGMQVIKEKTATGYMQVSSAETTAFDLVKYYKNAGYFSNVATVLAELCERLSAKRLLQIAKSGVAISVIQRLGYLLDEVGEERLTGSLKKWLDRQDFQSIPLRPGKNYKDVALNKKWSLYINDTVEIDI